MWRKYFSLRKINCHKLVNMNKRVGENDYFDFLISFKQKFKIVITENFWLHPYPH